jgi:hypothetical protein
MKKIFATLFFSVVFAIGFAQQPTQPKPVSADAAFSDALNKVVQDYTSNFIHIQGEKLPADMDAATFKSKVCVPGASGCKVMRYRSAQDKSASWQAALYNGEDFSEAVKFYKKVISQVKKSAVRGVATASAGFDGKTENADESIGFAVTTLRLKTTNKTFKDLVAEVEISGNITTWEVRLNVYTKKLIEQEKDELDGRQ